MTLTRRELAHILFGSAVAWLAGACQASDSRPAPTAATALLKPRASAGAELTAVLANSEVAQGRNRFALGLIDARNQPVASGSVQLEFFKLAANGTAEKRSDAPAAFRSVGGPGKGMWVSHASFAETGVWGAQVVLRQSSAEPATVARMNFDVRPRFSAPGYDEPAVRSASLTERDVGGDRSRICSGTPPCSLHALSIAQALEPGTQPLVVLFATPALCTSATCAPELEVILQLQSKYASQANFIHVELYQYPFENLKLVTAVEEWRLPSDPWTFIVDRSGIVRDRFEGAAPIDEIEPALGAVLA